MRDCEWSNSVSRLACACPQNLYSSRAWHFKTNGMLISFLPWAFFKKNDLNWCCSHNGEASFNVFTLCPDGMQRKCCEDSDEGERHQPWRCTLLPRHTLPFPGLKWKSTLVQGLADHMCPARTLAMTMCASCWYRCTAKFSRSHRELTLDHHKRLDQDLFVLTF